MASDKFFHWDKDSIPAIETNLFVKFEDKTSFIAGIYSITHNEQSQSASAFSIGRAGEHASGNGVSQIKGQLQFLTIDETIISKLIKAKDSSFEGIPTLRELNSYGGFDIVLSYKHPITNETYKKTYEGIMFDEVASAAGIDILKMEEAIIFTAQSVSQFKKA